MISSRAYTLLLYALPFLIEGVCGQRLPGALGARQVTSPTLETIPLPSSTPFLIIDVPLQPTSCTPNNITWVFAGSLGPFSLTATNFGVAQDPPPPSVSITPTRTFTDANDNVLAVPSGAQQIIFTSTIGDGIDPRESVVPWGVDVPQGWYRLLATVQAQLVAQSPPFFVQQGPDISCLSAQSPVSTSAPSPSPELTTPIPVSTPLPATASPSSTLGGATVSNASSSSSSFDTGAIIGIVIGAFALIVIVLMIYLCLHRRKNTLDKPIGGQLGGAKLVRGWGGLGSIDSNIHRNNRTSSLGGPTAAVAARNVKRRSASESFGQVFSEFDRSGNSSPLSLSEEKLSTSPASHGRNPFEDAEGLLLATLPSNGSRPVSARSSVQYTPLSLPQQGHGRISSSTVNTFSQAPGGSPPSMNEEILNRPGRVLPTEFPSYPPSSPPSAYQFYPSPVLDAMNIGRSNSTSSTTGGAPPSSSSSHPGQKGSRDSAGTQSITSSKKTPRKPVPVYDPSHPSAISISTSTPPSSSPLPHTPIGGTPVPTTPLTNPAPLASSSVQGHYAKKTGPGSTNELAHKSSFGPGGIEGKPMHYLIPDMPLNRDD